MAFIFQKEANNLTGLGVHGPLLVLYKSFTIERLFEMMKLRNSKESQPARSNLQKNLEALLSGPRFQLIITFKSVKSYLSHPGTTQVVKLKISI